MWWLAWSACSPAPAEVAQETSTATTSTEVACPPCTETEAPTPGTAAPDTGEGPATQITWDTSPPDGVEGTRITAIVSCSLLEGLPELFLDRSETEWRWTVSQDQPAPLAIPECAAFAAEGVVIWETAPSPKLSVLAGGVLHTLVPTPVEGLWAGTALPYNGSTPECDAALAALGLAWPVQLTMTIDPHQGEQP